MAAALCGSRVPRQLLTTARLLAGAATNGTQLGLRLSGSAVSQRRACSPLAACLPEGAGKLASVGTSTKGWVGLGAAAALAAAVAVTLPPAADARSRARQAGTANGMQHYAAALCEASGAGNVPASQTLPTVVEALPPGTRLEASIVRLYQFESCPFCRKVRSCLDYRKVPYEIVEVNPLSKAETKPIAPDYPKVPILWIEEGGRALQMRDSKTIVVALLGEDNPGVAPGVPGPSGTPATGKMWAQGGDVVGTIEEQWVRWTDLVLVQCIVLNVYRSLGESAETFKYLLTHRSFTWYARRAAALSGTAVMWGVAKSRKRKFTVTDERAALYEAVDTFAVAVRSGGGRFLGGQRPGAVDFNVFGILRSAEGCQTERDLLEHCAGILPWYGAMQEAVGPSSATNVASVRRG